jgi:phosphohistidine phosphatase SixA
MLFLVRHAHAGDKYHWQGPDSLRPLSSEGQAEAAGLLVRLDDYPVGRILSSPTVRCQQTVQPLAHDRYLPIELLPALGVDADPVALLALLADSELQDALVCTHGEVIAKVLGRLVMDGLAVNQPLAWPKGSTWLLYGTDGRLRSGRYLPPLPLADALTPRSVTWATRAIGLQPASQQRRHIGQHRQVGQRR